MNHQWLCSWIQEITQETAMYVHIYGLKVQEKKQTICSFENWMDKWMQYRILRYIGESFGDSYKTVALNEELCVVEPEKLLYNEKENCNQFQALYEVLDESWKPLLMRVMIRQMAIVQRLGNGG